MLAYDWNFLGLSLEAKPMTDEKVVDGSTFYECDTCDFYIFYQNKWYKQTFVTEDGINVCLYKSLMKKMFGKLFDGNITKGKLIKPDTGTNIEFTTSLPAQIIDLVGYGDTYQQTYSGKNLIDFGSGAYTSGGITATRDGNTVTVTGKRLSSVNYMFFTSGTINFGGVVPAGTYTLSIASPVSKQLQVSLKDSDGNSVGLLVIPVGETSITGIISEDVYSFRAAIAPLSYDEEVDVVFQDIQLEAGSAPTAFEPYVGGIPAPNPDYPQNVHTVTDEQTVTVSDGTNSQSYTIDLGTIELCKIGDYQDYIYKSGDDWYVHKEVGKYVFNGSEDWLTEPYGTNTWRLPNLISIYDFDADEIELKCDFANGVAFNSRGWADATKTCVCYTNATNVFVVRNTNLTSQASVQAATTGKNLYYKATPTDTQITDATLVGQLNALLNYTFPVGVNNITITADELPMPLKLIISEKE